MYIFHEGQCLLDLILLKTIFKNLLPTENAATVVEHFSYCPNWLGNDCPL